MGGKGHFSLIGLRHVSHCSLQGMQNHTLSGPLKPHGGFYKFCSLLLRGLGYEEDLIIVLEPFPNFRKGANPSLLTLVAPNKQKWNFRYMIKLT